MSRIGLKVIKLPEGVTATLNDRLLTVKGKKGELSFNVPPVITPKIDATSISFARVDDEKTTKQLHGTTRAVVANNVIGVSQGFEKNLVISGVGYRAALNGKNLELQVGYSHLVVVEPLPGITLSLKSPTEIKVSGIDKQVVGEQAALIRGKRLPDHYKNKGITYQGEKVILKKGKKGAKK